MSAIEMEHVLVLTDDIDSTRDFYCQVIGLRAGERPPLAFPGYWLYAGATPCVHVADRDAYTAHAQRIGLRVGQGAVDHVAFNGEDYDAAGARLERAGVAVVRNAIPGGPRQLFLDDPNGMRIEINFKTSQTEVR